MRLTTQAAQAGHRNWHRVMSIADKIEQFGQALTASELAELLQASEGTIFRLAASNRIPSFRIATCVRFDPRAIATWLRSSSTDFTSAREAA